MARVIQVRLDDDVEQTLAHLASIRGITIEEFVTQAVATEVFLAKQWAVGGRVLVQEPGGQLREVFGDRAAAVQSESNRRMNDLIRGAFRR